MSAANVLAELERLERAAAHDDMLADRAAKKHLDDSERFSRGRAEATREIVRLARTPITPTPSSETAL